MTEEDTFEYDTDKLRSREEMLDAIDGLLNLMQEETQFLDDIRTRIENDEPLEEIFSDFLQESQLDEIEAYLNSL